MAPRTRNARKSFLVTKEKIFQNQSYNSTEPPITLFRRTPLGRVELVKSITPFELRLQSEPRYHNEFKGQSRSCIKTEIDVNQVFIDFKEGISDFIGQFDLSALNIDQTQRAKIMLIEETDSFAEDDGGIGCAEGLKMPINLMDKAPVQKLTLL